VNEVEHILSDISPYKIKVKVTKSKDSGPNDPNDMLVYIIECRELIEHSFYDFVNFPFDKLNFQYRLVLSEVQFNNTLYRFDFYRTKDNMISFKRKIDRLPELDIDFK